MADSGEPPIRNKRIHAAPTLPGRAATIRLVLLAGCSGGGGDDDDTVVLRDRLVAGLLEADDAGQALIVREQGPSPPYGLWANRSLPGTGWRTPALIKTDDAGRVARPRVAIDPAGRRLAVWHRHDGTRNNLRADRHE